jgi:hypothetical protein
MRVFSTFFGILALAATLAPTRAMAQSGDISLHPTLTRQAFTAVTADLGSLLRSRHLGDGTTLGKGNVDIAMQLANAPAGEGTRSWSLAFPRVAARVGVSDRVDLGAWGGINADANYGVLGFDTKIALMTEGSSRPVSVSIRPSITSLVGPSDLWAASVGVDVAVSRAFGPLAPYAGVAATSTGAIERRDDLDLDPVSSGDSRAFAGVTYRRGLLSVAAEVEKGDQVSYGFRIGTRF